MIMMTQANILDFRAPVNETVDEALRGVWKDFIGSIAGIGKGVYHSDREMSAVLNHNLVLVHSLLMNTLLYRDLVNSSYRRLTRTKNWGWKTVFQDTLGKAGLFSVYKEAPVPLHDHPGTRGVMMVVEGEVEVERFTLKAEYRQSSESGPVELQRCDKKVLKPYDITWFGPEKGNVHSMQALTDQCVMLKVQLSQMKADRSWYFPLFSAAQEQETIPARRIVSRYL